MMNIQRHGILSESAYAELDELTAASRWMLAGGGVPHRGDSAGRIEETC